MALRDGFGAIDRRRRSRVAATAIARFRARFGDAAGDTRAADRLGARGAARSARRRSPSPATSTAAPAMSTRDRLRAILAADRARNVAAALATRLPADRLHLATATAARPPPRHPHARLCRRTTGAHEHDPRSCCAAAPRSRISRRSTARSPASPVTAIGEEGGARTAIDAAPAARAHVPPFRWRGARPRRTR